MTEKATPRKASPPPPDKPPAPDPAGADEVLAGDVDGESAADRRLRELEAENGDLRRQLAAAGIRTPGRPHRPSFGLSEGTRHELETTGRAVDPFTGDPLGDFTDVPGHRKDYGLPEGVTAESIKSPPLVPEKDRP